jgi:hypothetical protein
VAEAEFWIFLDPFTEESVASPKLAPAFMPEN